MSAFALYFMHMAANITVNAKTLEVGRSLTFEEEYAIWDGARKEATACIVRPTRTGG